MNNIKLIRFKDYAKGKRVAVIGIGISNRPLIKWLNAIGMDIVACDKLSEDDPAITAVKEEFNSENIKVRWSLGEGYLDPLKNEKFSFVFKTPKMRVETPELQEAVRKGAVLTSEMELFIDLCPATVFGITGSDGKTTTTTLVSEILKHAGYKVWLGGNIGTPLLDKVDEMTEEDMVVLELSSFQLLNMKQSVDVAIVTNVTPNHLDFHKDYDEYISSKTNIFKYQSASGKVVLNGKCDITFDMRKIAGGRISYFALNREDTIRAGEDALNHRIYTKDGRIFYENDGKITDIMAEDDIFIPGKHNVENFLAAIGAVHGFVSTEDIVAVAKEFTGVAHRIEFIRELDGVKFYNSSIDTSPNRTINTMNALEGRGMHGVLIAGGADKKCNYEGLGDAILKVCDRIILYGSNADLVEDIIAKEANGREYNLIKLPSKDGDVYEFESTRQAVVDSYINAINKARELARPGDIIIMSNVGTSYDHFRHFEHRGDMFKKLVNEL
ncbi:MAG: UDP-N-acetylmuramoyl-L-alanine--D-glutamate ligase [Saccharofermentans sp.]|nr:UDP-N-acetylmuramoyl-L-alanine--D-glutamate ligase [Saccharofermentans sp.]